MPDGSGRCLLVADNLAVSFENGNEFPRPADSNLFENIDPFSLG